MKKEIFSLLFSAAVFSATPLFAMELPEEETQKKTVFLALSNQKGAVQELSLFDINSMFRTSTWISKMFQNGLVGEIIATRIIPPTQIRSDIPFFNQIWNHFYPFMNNFTMDYYVKYFQKLERRSL